MANQPLYKYELQADVVNYLLAAVTSTQIRGEQQALSLINVLNILRTPANSLELKKDQLENLKSEVEAVGGKKDDKK